MVVKVKCVVRFRDMETEKIRNPGDEFSVTESRYDKLERLGFAEKMMEEPKTDKKPKETAR